MSGIGPGPLLQSLGVPVVRDCRDVGARMREHLSFVVVSDLNSARCNNWRFRGPGLAWSLLQYVGAHTGPLASGPFEVGAFSVAASNDNAARWTTVGRQPGISICGHYLALTGEGTVRIRSSAPTG